VANKRLNAIITIGGTVTGALSSALGSTRTKLRGIGDAVRDLEREQKRLAKTLANPGDIAGPVYHLQRRYEAVTREIERARKEQERLTRAVRGMDAGKAMMARGATMVGAAGAAAATGLVPVIAAASYEKAMLGVAKQVEGARDANGQLTATYWEMFKAIQKLGREVPVPTNELAKMAEQGARMGVAKDQLVDFVRTTAKMATAMDLPREELADDMGKIANLFKLPIPEIEKLGDAINYLDDNAVSKGADIIDFLRRTGGVAGAVKVTGKEMAALGSTLLSLGERSETASTATNAFIQKLAAAEKGPKKFQAAMEELGLSSAQVQKDMQKDAQGTILKVLDAVNKLPKDKQLGVLVELVGLEHSDTIAKLSNGVAEYRKQIDLVNSQKVEGSMSREFSAQLASTNAQWEISKNRVFELGVNIGTVLLPPLNALMGIVGSVTSVIADFALANPRLVKSLFAVAGAVVASLAVWGGLTAALGAVQVAFWGVTAAIIANPIGAIIAVIAAGAALIYANWDVIAPFFADLWAKVKEYTALAWEFVKTVFLNTTPLGMVIKNWEPLKAFFSSLFDEIKATVRAAIDWVLDKIAAVGNAWQKTKNFFGFGDEEAPAVSGKPTPRTPPPAPPMATGRGAGGAFTDNSQNSFTIVQKPNQDPRELANVVADEQERRRRGRAGGMLFDSPRGY